MGGRSVKEFDATLYPGGSDALVKTLSATLSLMVLSGDHLVYYKHSLRTAAIFKPPNT